MSLILKKKAKTLVAGDQNLPSIGNILLIVDIVSNLNPNLNLIIVYVPDSPSLAFTKNYPCRDAM